MTNYRGVSPGPSRPPQVYFNETTTKYGTDERSIPGSRFPTEIGHSLSIIIYWNLENIEFGRMHGEGGKLMPEEHGTSPEARF